MHNQSTRYRMFYHHTEWILNHQRFGFFMIGLIALSFINSVWLATLLLLVFSVEITLRILLMRHKTKTYPYRNSTGRSLDILFLSLDIIGALSLVVTIFQFSIPVEDALLARLIRAAYLLRTLRFFRYIDLQSAIYSPTYGMIISLLVLLSFFVTGTALWLILTFFFVELMVRWTLMKEMVFSSKRNKITEWAFWWIDLVATIAMVPSVAANQLGSVLRMLRLVRLLRPWLVILRNIKTVMKEGQYFQEINLILLLLAVLSILGGVTSHYLLGDLDFTRDGVIDDKDHEFRAHVWFTFRALTDPGNIVLFPDNNTIAIFSILAVVIGVFIFAFFIGIGASIVSGLMVKLRNERMNIANHIVMLGWNETSPFLLRELNAISQRTMTRLKLVLLNDEHEEPVDFQKEKWVSYRWGDMESKEDLKRVNLGSARQVIVNVPDKSPSETLSLSFFSLLAIREENPEIFISYAIPGFMKSRIKEHVHPLKVDWDHEGFYEKPTVVHSKEDIRANLFRQVLHYPDFDQILSHLMVPPRVDESAMVSVEWDGALCYEDGYYYLEQSTTGKQVEVDLLVKTLFSRGVILVAAISTDMTLQPVMAPTAPMQVFTLVGIALNHSILLGEVEQVFKESPQLDKPLNQPVSTELMPLESKRSIDFVLIDDGDRDGLITLQ